VYPAVPGVPMLMPDAPGVPSSRGSSSGRDPCLCGVWGSPGYARLAPAAWEGAAGRGPSAQVPAGAHWLDAVPASGILEASWGAAPREHVPGVPALPLRCALGRRPGHRQREAPPSRLLVGALLEATGAGAGRVGELAGELGWSAGQWKTGSSGEPCPQALETGPCPGWLGPWAHRRRPRCQELPAHPPQPLQPPLRQPPASLSLRRWHSRGWTPCAGPTRCSRCAAAAGG